MGRRNLNNEVLGFADAAADPSTDRDVQFNAEELKTFIENAVQKYVLLRYPGVHPGLNQLRNPSFEVDADETSPPTGWTTESGGAEVDDADYIDGSKSALIAGASANGSGIRQIIPVKKGQYVRLSAMCKASTASHAAVRLYCSSPAISVLSYHTGGGAWENLSVIYGPAAQDLLISAFLIKTSTTATDIWFDQAVCEIFNAPVYPVDYLDFRDMSADPGVDGCMQRNGDMLKWQDSGSRVRQLLDTGYKVLTVAAHSPYNVADDDVDLFLIDCGGAGGGMTFNLPTLADNYGRVLTLILLDNTNDLLVDGEGTETINGSTTVTCRTLDKVIRLRAGEDEWHLQHETRYVARDVTAADFSIADFGTTGSWQANALDLSSIVPRGAIAVHLEIFCDASSGSGHTFGVRRNATQTWNRLYAHPISTDGLSENGIVAIDSDRLLDYYRCCANLDTIDVAVVGYILGL